MRAVDHFDRTTLLLVNWAAGSSRQQRGSWYGTDLLGVALGRTQPINTLDRRWRPVGQRRHFKAKAQIAPLEMCERVRFRSQSLSEAQGVSSATLDLLSGVPRMEWREQTLLVSSSNC